MTFTWTVRLSASPKPLYAVQLKVPESFLLIFFLVSTFPSCSTPVFPWFPVFSLVQVMFGSGLPDALHVNCKLSPSWTVCSRLISVIIAGTKSRKSLWKKWIHLNDKSLCYQNTFPHAFQMQMKFKVTWAGHAQCEDCPKILLVWALKSKKMGKSHYGMYKKYCTSKKSKS